MRGSRTQLHAQYAAFHVGVVAQHTQRGRDRQLCVFRSKVGFAQGNRSIIQIPHGEKHRRGF